MIPRGRFIKSIQLAAQHTSTASQHTPLMHQTSKMDAAACRDLLTDLGPCFIKAGQVLANRPDIIRQDYMDELCVLQDDVPSFPDDVAFRIIEENLGRPMEEVLSAVSEHPVAAASLGQVCTRPLSPLIALAARRRSYTHTM